MFWQKFSATKVRQSRLPAVRIFGRFHLGIFFTVSIRHCTQPIPGYQSLNRSAIQSKNRRSAPFPSLILVKDELQIASLQLVHRWSVGDDCALGERGDRFLWNRCPHDFRGQAIEGNHVIGAKGNGTADSVLQLADIAWKRIRAKSQAGFTGKTVWWFSFRRRGTQEMSRQNVDVLSTFTERREIQGDNAQAIE
jgi:hypothetical protein